MKFRFLQRKSDAKFYSAKRKSIVCIFSYSTYFQWRNSRKKEIDLFGQLRQLERFCVTKTLQIWRFTVEVRRGFVISKTNLNMWFMSEVRDHVCFTGEQLVLTWNILDPIYQGQLTLSVFYLSFRHFVESSPQRSSWPLGQRSFGCLWAVSLV